MLPACPAREKVRSFQRTLGAVGGWIFSNEHNPSVPMDRYEFDKLLRAAETKAKLPKLVGGLWHPYRRKWATERKHLPIADVAAAGGWKTKSTLLDCYTHATPEGLVAVVSEPKKIRDRVLEA